MTAVPDGMVRSFILPLEDWNGVLTDHEIELQTLIILLRGVPGPAEQRLVLSSPIVLVPRLGNAGGGSHCVNEVQDPSRERARYVCVNMYEED